MKRLGNLFKMMVTAVICFFMGMLPKKRIAESSTAEKGFKNGCFSGRETRGMSGCSERTGKGREPGHVSALCKREYIRENRYRRPKINKKFFWLKGPGDRPLRKPLARRICAAARAHPG